MFHMKHVMLYVDTWIDLDYSCNQKYAPVAKIEIGSAIYQNKFSKIPGGIQTQTYLIGAYSKHINYFSLKAYPNLYTLDPCLFCSSYVLKPSITLLSII